MTINEIVGTLKAGGLDASSTNRSAAVYVTEARSGRAEPGWFGFRIICDSEATERRARAILSRWYDIDANGSVWRLSAKNRVPLMAIKRGGTPPTPPTPTGDYMYFEAAQANSTVSLISSLTTAPDLEYSTDGEAWQEWQHTTADGTHTFDTITLGVVGDKVYFRGDNPDGLGYTDEDEIWQTSSFNLTGSINGGGNVMSLLDKTEQLTEVPDYGLMNLFTSPSGKDVTALTTPPDMSSITSVGASGCEAMYYRCTSLTAAADMPLLTTIGESGCDSMYYGCTSLTSAADMPVLVTIAEDGCAYMYNVCTFNMSNDGTTLNFAFPTPPITAGETTYNTYYDLAQWMGNTNGFN